MSAEHVGAWAIVRPLSDKTFARSFEGRGDGGDRVFVKVFAGVRPETSIGESFSRVQAGLVGRLREVGAGVAVVLDHGIQDDRFYTVSRWTPGRPLAQAYPDLLPMPRWDLASELAGIVARLHEHGVVHRDLTPANVHVHDGAFTLVDFDGAGLDDESGHPLAAPPYAAPEHFMDSPGRVFQQAFDVFSLGMVVYELLTGFFPLSRREVYDHGVFSIDRFLAALTRTPQSGRAPPSSPRRWRSSRGEAQSSGQGSGAPASYRGRAWGG